MHLPSQGTKSQEYVLQYLNLIVDPYHLEDLLNYSLRDHTPRAPGSIDLGQGQSSVVITISKVMLCAAAADLKITL